MPIHAIASRTMRGRFFGTLAVVVATALPAGTAQAQPTPPDQAPLPPGALFRIGRGHAGQVAGLGMLDNGRTVLTSARDDTLRLWSLESGRSTGQLVVPRSRPKSIAVRPDGKLLAVLTPDGKLQIRELPGGKLLKEWQAETVENVGSVAFSPDGKWVVSNGRNTTLWDVATGKLLRQLSHPPEPMGALAFSPDGKQLCTGSMTGMIGLWDAHSGRDLGQLTGHTKYIDQVAFSPDGELLASVSHDGTARLWDLHTQSAIRSVMVDFGVSLALSPDGHTLAVGGSAGIVGVWEIASGKERATFRGESGTVMSLLFAPDGKTLISGHVKSTALCWDLTGLGPARQQGDKTLSADDLETEWQLLGSDDSPRAFRALWRLAAAGEQAVTKAREQLQPAKAIDGQVIAQRIIDLNDGRFEVRQKAMTELRKAGDQAWPALRKALAAAASPLETKKRARRLLEQQFAPDPARLRLIRQLELLEHIDNRASRALLQTLAKGAPQAWLTLEANKILQRTKSKGLTSAASV